MQITYFPYLALKEIEELNFGGFKVWNPKKKLAEYIPDESLRNQVKTLLSTNIRGGRVIEDMGVVSIGDTDFREFNLEEYQSINELKLLLFLSFLARNNVIADGPNGGWMVATSENFSPVFQNFQLGSDDIAESAGFIVNLGIGGYKISQTQFKAPSHVIETMRFSLDGKLITQLLSLKNRHKGLYNRILRATDLLFESYFNDSNVSQNTRILLQVSSYEVLLDLPESGQRRVLKNEIGRLINTRPDKYITYSYERLDRASRNMVRVKERKSIKCMWADRFYTLRNHIIHGNKIRSSDFLFYYQRHMDVAVKFFVLTVKKLINEKKGTKIFHDEIVWKEFEDSRGDKHFGLVYVDNDLTARLSAYFRRSRRK